VTVLGTALTGYTGWSVTTGWSVDGKATAGKRWPIELVRKSYAPTMTIPTADIKELETVVSNGAAGVVVVKLNKTASSIITATPAITITANAATVTQGSISTSDSEIATATYEVGCAFNGTNDCFVIS
jgi:hypothetical protein